MKEFVYTGKEAVITKAILRNVEGLGYGSLNKAFRNRDVKVNGVRVGTDALVRNGDKITVFFNENILKPRVIYSDENVLVAFKRAGIETSDGKNSFLDLVRTVNKHACAVHRLDANTQGIVIFALNPESEAELLKAFKTRTVEKHYLALVAGSLKKKEAALTAYLTKDAEAGKVTVRGEKTKSSREIITLYKMLAESKELSVLEVKLITGATHQIRAHLAFCGNPILGDDLYGNRLLNKKVNTLKLTAYRLKLNFKDGVLSYLDGKEFLLEGEKERFLKYL